ncbi:MAG: hypothetical protein NZ846_07650 [Thermus sp.]|uniref:hypothetical protein n=1 Tax=unclassified Thermus TaxID=2619321 RepID=UPI00059C34D2|nr:MULTISPECIES: hypothetical protein [unclassified Thermus]MCS6867926.1 hypothetical protein [Thermus sp.]MCS7218835.1 hypothetical protein [Thermus sp.]MCX7850941.1 hypothetical protein [Thermus sp.]MDW8017604.1 hypothetical protein [Thermus sp.]MDW8356631.1 hypothetical protein [Thermus sp.]
MRVLFVEGKDKEGLLALAQRLPHPYGLLEGEGVWLLQVWGASEEAQALAQALPGVRVWAFTLRDGVVYRGCGKRSATSP